MPDDPQRVGPYWLASRLGAGGQGVVYEAYDSAGARCAVKVLRTADTFAKDRFRKEVTAAQRVDSFCTARVLAADLEADPPYIASELIDGRDLQTVVRERGPLTDDDLVRLATGVATALTAIHAASVVHRDLKPGNVLLGPDGPRVIDFGIARTQEMSLTATGRMMGTPGYMAPEVLRGSRADVKSDVFAWGAVVLFAATGRAPFHGENLGEIVVRITELHPDLTPLPERLRSLVGAALSKEPSLRPGSDELLFGLLTGGDRLPSASSAAELLKRGARAAILPVIAGHASATLPDWGAVAEQVFVELDPATQAAAQELLLRLVEPGEAPDGSQDGVRAAGPEELFGGRPAHEAAAARQALAMFNAERILIAGPDGFVRPVGAALLKAWPRLGSWAAEHRAALRVLRRTGDAARGWQQAGRKSDDLLLGGALRAALEQAATAPAALRPNALERSFLDAARKEESRRTRQRRRLQGGVAVLLVLALAAGTVAWNLRRTNAEQRALATARAVASVAESMRTSAPETAALLSLAAWQVAPAAEARSALYRSALQRETSVFRDPTTPPAGIETYVSRSLSAGGRFLTTEVHKATASQTYHYDIRTGRPVDLGDAGKTPGPVAADGRFAVSDGVVWNLGTDEPVGKVPKAAGTVLALAAGGGRALTRTQDEGSNVVDTRTGSTLLRLSATGPVLVDDGRYLVSCPAGGHPLLYDLGTGKQTRMRGADPETQCDETSQVWSSADGTRLLTSANGHLYVWHTPTRKLVSSIRLDGAPEDVAAAISPDGGLVARCEGGAVVLTSAEHLEQPLLTHEAGPREPVLVGEEVGQVLEIDSAARELVYMDGASVHVLDLGVISLPRQAEQEEIGSYGPGAASLRTVRSTIEPSRLESWSVAEVTPANGAAADKKTSDVAAATKHALGRNRGEGDLPVAFSPDGILAAYPNQEPTERESFDVLVQDVRTGKVRHSVALGAPERGRAVTLAFSADGSTLVVSRLVDDDQDARSVDVVDVRTGKKTRTLNGIGGHRIALGGSGNGLVLVTSSGDRANLSEGKTARSALGMFELNAVAFSPDGKTLAAAEPNGIALWNADGTRRLGQLPGPAVSHLRFSPNGDQLVGVVGGERVHIWDVRSQQPLGGVLPGIEDPLLDVAFDDRGDLRLAGERVRSHTVSLDPERLARTICERVHRAKNLTRAEWEQNVPDAPYRQVCG